MFNIGGGEFLVIALIALIVLGPQRLPDAARQVGKAMGELRRLSSGFQNELKSAFDETTAATEPTPGASAAGDAPSAKEADALGTATARPRRRAPLKADPVPDRPQPRTKGR